MNCIEATRTTPTPVLGDLVDHFEMIDGRQRGLTGPWRRSARRVTQSGGAIGRSATSWVKASIALFDHSMEQADADRVERIHRLGRRHDPLVEDHAFIHQRLQAFSNSGSVLSAGPPPLV